MQVRLVFVSLLLGVLFAAGCASVEYADVADARVGGASRDTGNAGFAVFYLVCGQYDDTLDVWQAFAGTQGGSLPGSINVASDEIELRVEQTGGNVNFYARAAGSMSWTSVSTTTFPA